MSGRAAEVGGGLRYEADERAPAALTLGLGVQLALITVAVPILIPTAVMRAGGAADSHLAWAVFAAVAISGVTTALQAIRYGRIGGGHVLVMGSSVAFIGGRHYGGGDGRSRVAGDPGRLRGASPAPVGREARPVPPGPDPGRVRDRDHAGAGHGDADRVRHAGATYRTAARPTRRHRSCWSRSWRSSASP